MISLLWLRRDLRLHDHPAVHAASAGAERLVPVFCLDDRLLHGRHRSGPRTQFLLESLTDLDRSLRARDSGLVVRHDAPERALPELARQLRAERVHFTSDVGAFATARDQRVVHALRTAGAKSTAHPGQFVSEHESIRTQTGEPYTVFTPFYNTWRKMPRRRVLPAPDRLPPLPDRVDRGRLPTLRELGLLQEVERRIPGGERPGRARMRAFLASGVANYHNRHDTLSDDGSSRLSPYLHLGCISPRELEQAAGEGDGPTAYIRQLCWRDFYAHVLMHRPENANLEHQRRYRGTLPYVQDPASFAAWCDGRTGYPILDAAMRQLRREGWMHNRCRLLAGSFLTKHLAADWRLGEQWFMRLLVDGDQASNNGNWQWIASVGVDPQPVSRRLLSPARQQAKLDPDGSYVRRYLPELRHVPTEHLAEPWKMPLEVQRRAGCVIGRDYPPPIVDHATARRDALARYEHARSTPLGAGTSLSED